MTMKLSKEGATLIKNFESLSLTAYHGAADAPGVITIGWGHVLVEGEKFDIITLEQADALFEKDVKRFVDAVNTFLGDVQVIQNQFDAVISLAYNIGTSGIKHSQVLTSLIAGNIIAAADGFKNWIRSAGKVRKGLIRRRAVEKIFFLEGRDLYKEIFSDQVDPYKILGIKAS